LDFEIGEVRRLRTGALFLNELYVQFAEPVMVQKTHPLSNTYEMYKSA
jgi:hypothetical protein